MGDGGARKLTAEAGSDIETRVQRLFWTPLQSVAWKVPGLGSPATPSSPCYERTSHMRKKTRITCCRVKEALPGLGGSICFRLICHLNKVFPGTGPSEYIHLARQTTMNPLVTSHHAWESDFCLSACHAVDLLSSFVARKSQPVTCQVCLGTKEVDCF